MWPPFLYHAAVCGPGVQGIVNPIGLEAWPVRSIITHVPARAHIQAPVFRFTRLAGTVYPRQKIDRQTHMAADAQGILSAKVRLGGTSRTHMQGRVVLLRRFFCCFYGALDCLLTTHPESSTLVRCRDGGHNLIASLYLSTCSFEWPCGMVTWQAVTVCTSWRVS
jgi:hypothetical protein